MACINSIARVLSQYLYWLIFLIISGIVFLYRSDNYSGPIPLDYNAKSFDHSQKIRTIAHFSDVHLSPKLPNSTLHLNDSMKTITQVIKPNVVIFTGDLADNFVEHEPGPSYQHEDHWKLYSEVRDYWGFPKEKIVEVMGNHDAYSIMEYNNDSFPVKYLIRQYPHTDAFKYEIDGIRFIGLQPYDYPTASGPQLFCPPVTTKMINTFEEIISSSTDCDQTFVGTHFPHDLLYPIASSSTSGLGYSGIIKKNNISGVIVGHTHPPTFESLHLPSFNTIEYVGIASRTQVGFGLITIDNGRVRYTHIDNEVKVPMVVTMPVPDADTPRVQIYNDFEIRVLVYQEVPQLEFEVKGDITTKITTSEKLADNLYLFSQTVHLENGHHSITVSSTLTDFPFSDTIEFSVGVEGKPRYEPHKRDLVDWSIVVIFALFNILLVFIGVTSLIPHKVYSFLSETNKWQTSKYPSTGTGKQWLYSVLLGPLLIAYKITLLPIWARIYIVVLSFWSWVFPLAFYPADGKVGVLFFYGYIITGKARLDIFSFLYHAVYLGAHVFWILSEFCALLVFGFSVIFDLVIAIVCIAAASYYWYEYGSGVAYGGYWAASFGYFIFPLVSLIFLVVLNVFKYFKKDLFFKILCKDIPEEEQVEMELSDGAVLDQNETKNGLENNVKLDDLEKESSEKSSESSDTKE